jgi:hypothetical protein
MKYRVIEDPQAPDDKRFIVQHSPFGHTWTEEPEISRFTDQMSAEIEMERRAAPRVVATLES